MRLRATSLRATGLQKTWTSLLALLLLSFWSAASACELQCDLPQASACCLPDSAPHSMAAMPGMEHRVTRTDVPLLSDASCPHSVCAPLPALLTQRGPTLPAPAPNLEALAANVLVHAPDAVSSLASVRGPPPVLLASPVSLHILARV